MGAQMRNTFGHFFLQYSGYISSGESFYLPEKTIEKSPKYLLAAFVVQWYNQTKAEILLQANVSFVVWYHLWYGRVAIFFLIIIIYFLLLFQYF